MHYTQNTINTAADRVYIFSHYQCYSVGKNKWIINDWWGKIVLTLPLLLVLRLLPPLYYYTFSFFVHFAVCRWLSVGCCFKMVKKEIFTRHSQPNCVHTNPYTHFVRVVSVAVFTDMSILWHFYLLFIFSFLLWFFQRTGHKFSVSSAGAGVHCTVYSMRNMHESF